MKCVEPEDIPGFTSFEHGSGDSKRTIYERGPEDRPGVIVLHELPGMVESCIEFAEELSTPTADFPGFRVFMPLLFGRPGQDGGPRDMLRAGLCIRREFTWLSTETKSPLTSWVAEFAGEVAGRSGGSRVGIIGMCLTGSLVFGLVAEPSVGAVVASQPSLPIALPLPIPGRADRKKAVGLPFDELAAAAGGGAAALALRYEGDKNCPGERFASLAEAYGHDLAEPTPGQRQDEQLGNLRVIAIPGRDHALLTLHRSEYAVDAVKGFLAGNL